MNKYYVSNEQFNSNKRIFEAYYTETEVKPGFGKKAFEFFLTMFSILTCERARTLVHAIVISLSLIGLIGIVGAMENGTISMGAGILAALVLIGIEILSLKKSYNRHTR